MKVFFPPAWNNYRFYPMSILLALGIILSGESYGQNILNQTDTVFIQSSDTIYFSQKSLVPGSLKLIKANGQEIPNSYFELKYWGGILIAKENFEASLCYASFRYFAVIPPQNISLYSQKKDSSGQYIIPDQLSLPKEKGPAILWETEGIRKQGSLTRGITVGNNRGVSLTSGLRLQMEGDLGGGLYISGAITDDNIPVQPDGTTQQISDFDRIYVKLRKGPFQATIGDYEVKRSQSRFGNFYRNVQGLRVDYTGERQSAFASMAVAKGKFHTNSFIGKEGVSGPYRLTGQNGERYFFVLAGSEKVFLNGKLMIRGENEDYVINYNTAEVTFTTKHLINSATRIVVDFEYNDRYYNRSLLVAGVKTESKDEKWKMNVSYSRDADNANAPFSDEEAFEEVRADLKEAGDDQTQALSSGIRNVGFDDNGIRYARRDTSVNDSTYERYIYSFDPEEAVYEVFFSFVGEGGGNYVRDFSRVNGNIFQWIAPNENGISQGSYAPVRRWVLPQQLQVMNTTMEYKPNNQIKINSETGLSIQDLNRLSSLDDNDNLGLAQWVEASWQTPVKAKTWNVGAKGSFQYIDDEYQNLDRIYRPEYERVWNLLDPGLRKDERIYTAGTSLAYGNLLGFDTEFGLRNTHPGHRDFRQVYRFRSQWEKGIAGNYTYTRIDNRDPSLHRKAWWIRQEGDLYHKLGPLKAGMKIWVEDRKEFRADTLERSSLQFVDFTPYISTTESRKWKLNLSLNYRKEKAYSNGEMTPKSTAITGAADFEWAPQANWRMKGRLALRDFRVLNTAFREQGLSDARSLNGLLQHRYSTPRQWLRSLMIYEVNSEQVAKRELRYLEVNPGQGQYEWIDINENGIQDLEEFQPGRNPLLANFIRVSLPTRELFPTTRLNLSANATLDLRKLWKETPPGLMAIVRQFRYQLFYQLRQNKAQGSQFQDFVINPVNTFNDSTLLDALFNFKQIFSIFPNHPRGEIQFSVVDIQNKLFLSSGSEYRRNKFGSFHSRLTLNKRHSLEADIRKGKKVLQADSLTARNFDINFWEVSPQFNTQVNRKWRFSLAYRYTQKANQNDTGEKNLEGFIHRGTVQSNVNLLGRNRLGTKLELLSVRQKGNGSFATEYELREGLQPGINTIWQLNLSLFVLSNVELGIIYEGRSSESVTLAHSGRIQVSALFD